MQKLPAAVQMVEKLIGIPSVSSMDPSLDQSNAGVVDSLAEWAKGIGFQVEMIEVPGSAVRKVDLIATLGSDLADDSAPGRGSGLVLSGHTDTVPFDEAGWKTDPFVVTERDNALFGLGTADMKSFLALALVAASRVDRSRLQEPLRLVATADEECTMAGARALASRDQPLGRVAVIGEPTSLRPIRMHKGKHEIRISLEGRSGHSSNPALGINALDGMHEVIGTVLQYREELRRRYREPAFDVPEPTMNLGRIQGGDAANRICARCELEVDLRSLPEMDCEGVLGTLQERVVEVARGRGLRCTFERTFDIRPFEVPADAEVVRAVAEATGKDAGTAAFATEAPFYQKLGAETVIVGPGSIDVAHQPNEHLPLSSIPQDDRPARNADRAFLSLVALLRKRRPSGLSSGPL